MLEQPNLKSAGGHSAPFRRARKVSGGMEDLPKPFRMQKSLIIFTRVMNELDSHECIQAGRIKDTAGDCAMTCGKTATIGKFYLYYSRLLKLLNLKKCDVNRVVV